MRKALILLLPMLLISWSCKKPEESTTNSPAAGPATASNLKIVYIPKNTGNPYFTDVIKGFEEAAAQGGFDFTTTGPSSAEATSQIPFIKEQIQRKVDVIALTPNSPDALNPVLDEAKAAGIVVITVDADLEKNESHRDAAVLPTDFSKVGEAQLELIGSQMNFEGEFAILSATRDAPNQNAWIAGINEALKDPKYSKMKLVATVYGDDEPQKSTTETEALLTKYPNLKGILAPTSVGLAAGAQSVQIAGVFPGGPHAAGPGLMITGLSTPNQMKRFVTDGVVKSFQLWSPHDMGWLACNLGAAIKSGKVKPAEGASFDDPKLGSHTFGKNSVVNTGPLVTFDKGNIEKYDF